MSGPAEDLPGDVSARSDRVWQQRMADQEVKWELRSARLEDSLARERRRLHDITSSRAFRLLRAVGASRKPRGLLELPKAIRAALSAGGGQPSATPDFGVRISDLAASDRAGTLARARALIDERRWQDAADQVSRVVGDAPFHFDALRVLLDAQIGLGDTAAAQGTLARLRYLKDDTSLRDAAARLGNASSAVSVRLSTWAEVRAERSAPSARVLVFPDAPKNNFYSLLYGGLNTAGVATRVVPWNDDAVRDAVTEPRTAIHLHWTAWLDPARGGPGIDRFLDAISDTPLIWTVHNAAPHDAAEAPEVRGRLAEAATLIHVMHPEEADEGLGISIAPEKLLRLDHPSYVGAGTAPIPRPVARSRLGLPTDAFVVAAPGQIRPYRGTELLLAAMRASTEADMLLVAGEPTPTTTSLDLVARLHQAPGIETIARYLTGDELNTVVCAADVIALPYRKILNSGAAWFALSAGRPIVVPDLAVFGWVKASDVGEVFETASEVSLARAIDRSRRFGSDPGLEERITTLLAPRHPAAIGASFAEAVIARLSW